MKLGERFVKASHVLGERSHGVILERHALLKTADNKLVGDSGACTRKLGEDLFPGMSTTSGGGVIVSGEHLEKGAERFGGVLERFPKPGWIIASAPKTYEVRKDLCSAICTFFS